MYIFFLSYTSHHPVSLIKELALKLVIDLNLSLVQFSVPLFKFSI